MGSLNVRTLKSEENLDELEEAFEAGKINILGLVKVRREGDIILETSKGNILCYIGQRGGQKGVGF